MKTALGIGAILAMGAVCVAADMESTNSTVITSKTLSFDYGRSIAVFEGDVVVVDPQINIWADWMSILLGQSNEVKSVTAVGHVRMQSGDKKGFCNKAVYIAREGEIIMTGDACTLMRSQDVLTGKSIKFWLHEERVQCTPGRLVIYPGRDREDALPSMRGMDGKDRKEAKPLKALPGQDAGR